MKDDRLTALFEVAASATHYKKMDRQTDTDKSPVDSGCVYIIKAGLVVVGCIIDFCLTASSIQAGGIGNVLFIHTSVIMPLISHSTLKQRTSCPIKITVKSLSSWNHF